MDSFAGGYLGVMVFMITPMCKGAVYTFTSVETYAATTWNDNDPARVFDGGNITCYMGGREQHSFWKVVLPDSLVVNKIVLTGEYRGSLMVRVGSAHDTLNRLAGHESNRPCRQLDTTGIFSKLEFECIKKRQGHVISVNGDSSEPNNMVICGIEIY